MLANKMRTIIALQAFMILLCIRRGDAQECGLDGDCDSHERCRTWKDEGECYRSPDYMKRVCPVSCIGMKSPSRDKCEDIHENCPVWFHDAECETNVSVKKYCRLSCDSCNKKSNDASKRMNVTRDSLSASNTSQEAESCTDHHENCSGWANRGECEKNPKYMLANCKKSCGTCRPKPNDQSDEISMMLEQTAKFGPIQTAEGDRAKQTLDNVKSMLEYMEKSDDYLSLPSKIKENCRNNKNLCSFWAAIGECEKNKSFMKVQCAPACNTCHLIDMETRCPKLPDALPGLQPGDLNKMFERIVETAPGNRTLTDEDRRQMELSEMPEYTVTVHSHPGDDSILDISIEEDRKLPPWLITLDNFLTDEECDAIVQHGYDSGYKRSEDVGDQKFDGTVDSVQSKGRTSENAWCSTKTGCREATVPHRILDRMSTIMGIPPDNSEDIQILKYEVGQFYNTHHDYIPHQRDRQCGPRVLTFFLYLSDVEAGGGTDFPTLGITVTPKKGRAVLWPSVYSSEPMNKDRRTNHQALPVEAGVKFGANAWIHMFDYQTPQRNGCN